MAKEKAKKKKAFQQRRGEKGKSTLVDYAREYLAGGPKAFHDIVEHVRKKRTAAGFDQSPSFSGQVWHATNRIADPVPKQRGQWKLSSKKLAMLKPKAKANPGKSVSKSTRQPREKQVEKESEQVGEEGAESGEGENDDDEGDEAEVEG